jgi:hypothetical protein
MSSAEPKEGTEMEQWKTAELVVRDSNDVEWLQMATGSFRQVMTKMVAEAGSMAMAGWMTVGIRRNQITMVHPEDDSRRTLFRLRKLP